MRATITKGSPQQEPLAADVFLFHDSHALNAFRMSHDRVKDAAKNIIVTLTACEGV